jgi:outer membrane biogenesis lipoprotein LolB
MTDGGTEFTGAEFQQMLAACGIPFNVSNNHASHVKRLIRSIQSILGKYTTDGEYAIRTCHARGYVRVQFKKAPHNLLLP